MDRGDYATDGSGGVMCPVCTISWRLVRADARGKPWPEKVHCIPYAILLVPEGVIVLWSPKGGLGKVSHLKV